MKRLFRFLLAFLGFLPLAALATLLFFGACITMFDPAAGASGNLARANPPPFIGRLAMASLWLIGSLSVFGCAAFVAHWGISADSRISGPLGLDDATTEQSTMPKITKNENPYQSPLNL